MRWPYALAAHSSLPSDRRPPSRTVSRRPGVEPQYQQQRRPWPLATRLHKPRLPESKRQKKLFTENSDHLRGFRTHSLRACLQSTCSMPRSPRMRTTWLSYRQLNDVLKNKNQPLANRKVLACRQVQTRHSNRSPRSQESTPPTLAMKIPPRPTLTRLKQRLPRTAKTVVRCSKSSTLGSQCGV